MKISKTNYAYLEKHIDMFSKRVGKELMTETRNNVSYVNSQFASFVWLVFHKANKEMKYQISDTLYEAGLNDDHIETALKKILKEYR